MDLIVLSDQLCESCNGACCRDIVCPPSDPNEAGIWGWLYGLPQLATSNLFVCVVFGEKENMTLITWPSHLELEPY